MRDIFCAVTDLDWFDYLRLRPSLSEINFWKPTPGAFNAVAESGIFAFKLKAPYNKIGGFGILTTSADAQISLAWEAFGEGNGFPDLRTFVEKIRSIRKNSEISEYSYIGVRVLAHQVFFPEHLWFDPPTDWAVNTVTGKTYSTESAQGLKLLRDLEERAKGFFEPVEPCLSFTDLAEQPHPDYKNLIPLHPRKSQGTFRINVTRAYGNQCAVSGTCVRPALDVAYIRPCDAGGDYSTQNGILLRKDILGVFDAGLATFDEKRRFIVSPKVKEMFTCRHDYASFHGRTMRLTVDPELAPCAKFLEWHRTNRYVGD